MNEEEKSIYSHYKMSEFISDEDTCHKISADSNLKGYKMSNNSPFENKRVSDHSFKYLGPSYTKPMSYSHKKLNAKLKNCEKENEVFHREQRRTQLNLSTDEFSSNRFHTTQRIHVIQSSVIFNNQKVPSTSFSDDHAHSNSRFSGNRTFPSTSFSDDRTFPSTSFHDRSTFPSTSFCNNCVDTSKRISDHSKFPSTSFSNNRADTITRFSDDWTFSSTIFCDNRKFSSKMFSNNRTFFNTSFSDNCADPTTGSPNNRNFPRTSFSDNCAVPNTSFSDILAFPSTSCYSDQVVQSKSFSDNKAIKSTNSSGGKVTSRVNFKKCYSMEEENLEEKINTNLNNTFEDLKLETSSDKDSIEVNVSDSSDYESMTETSPPSFPKCKKPAKESDSPVNKRKAKRKKKRGKILEILSGLESLSPSQKLPTKGNSETVVTQTGKSKEDLFNDDYEKHQENRKRHISENQCNSFGVSDLTCSFKKFKLL